MNGTRDPSSFLAQAEQALRRRDAKAALDILLEAERLCPPDLGVRMQKAAALRMAGDFLGAIDALDAALTIDPYNFVAMLSKGSLIERLEGERAATPTYRTALIIAPETPPPSLAAPLARAREVVAKTSEALARHLTAEVQAEAADLDAPTRARFEESLKIFAGTARIYESEALLLKYPRLPAIPFFDRSWFPWFPELEAATDTIRGELEEVLKDPPKEYQPYIDYPPNVPVNQWAELNHSPRWSSYFLWKDGVRQDDACARCPKTAALLDRLPLARQPGFSPTAIFSALEAHTHIPPHSGSTNIRLLVHLPLILPGPARFRVGNETREWKMGEAWAFDDSINHEAWNDADKLRVILIIDVWNPLLTEAERELVSKMMAAKNAFFTA